MNLEDLVTGFVGIVAGIVLIVSFIKVPEIGSRKSVIGWNVARVASVLVLMWWLVEWGSILI